MKGQPVMVAFPTVCPGEPGDRSGSRYVLQKRRTRNSTCHAGVALRSVPPSEASQAPCSAHHLHLEEEEEVGATSTD